MTKLRPAYVFLAVGVALIFGWFYWYEYRPSKVSEECAAHVTELSRFQSFTTDAGWIEDWTSICTSTGGPRHFHQSMVRGDEEKAERDAFVEPKNALDE